MPSVIESRIADVEKHAAKAFAKFAFTCEGSGDLRSYVCRNTEGSIYNRAFRVTFWPGSMAITGDSGDFIWSRSHDMMAWAKTAIGDVDYFVSKVVAGQVQEYDREVFIESLRFSESFDEATLESFLEEEDLDTEEAAAVAYFLVLEGDEMPPCRNFTHSFLWCRESVRWLLKQLDGGR